MKLNANFSGLQIFKMFIHKEKAYDLIKSSKKPAGSNLSPEEAIGLMIEASLTVADYDRIRNEAKKQSHDIFPSYKTVIFRRIFTFL